MEMCLVGKKLDMIKNVFYDPIYIKCAEDIGLYRKISSYQGFVLWKWKMAAKGWGVGGMMKKLWNEIVVIVYIFVTIPKIMQTSYKCEY